MKSEDELAFLLPTPPRPLLGIEASYSRLDPMRIEGLLVGKSRNDSIPEDSLIVGLGGYRIRDTSDMAWVISEMSAEDRVEVVFISLPSVELKKVEAKLS